MIPGITPAQLKKRRPEKNADIISIQSQVIYGTVGNSIAQPVLESHGWQVLAVPTFLLSNTPDYPSCFGGEISSDWFHGFLQGLHDRGQDAQLRAIITGYLGSTGKAGEVSRWLPDTLRTNPDAMVIIDPVMGDDDCGYYVDPALLEWYRDSLAPMATGLTPNRFELACLSGKTLENDDDVISAARTLLNQQTQWIIVTSAARGEAGKTLRVICVTAEAVHIIEHEAYDGAPKGTGDMFTAQLTALLLKGLTLFDAAELACQMTRRSVLDSLNDGTGLLNPRPDMSIGPGGNETD
ncbi:PfkB family carbohydrate kinase [Pantoea coffeiphila]|uniref:pyridoxal kinase n=1 Tax=Pantoea coffeiphila TaxID=1465635 RepID=A0A2S9IEP0_9GAMM|nr:PfkB family carbohydrate kinase [Pantoea coffeiphila]PRD16261.1 bifunctional pyridoxal kinase/hydroxymethylpyrimidine kinase [Pantoea coffeiphila]